MKNLQPARKEGKLREIKSTLLRYEEENEITVTSNKARLLYLLRQRFSGFLGSLMTYYLAVKELKAFG